MPGTGKRADFNSQTHGKSANGFRDIGNGKPGISGQNCYIGFFDDPQNPGDFARFNFSGTVTTSVGCETGYTFGGTTNGTGLDTFEAQSPECGNYKSPAHLPHRIQEIQRCVPYRRKCGLLRQPQHSQSVLVRGLCRRVDKQQLCFH